MRLIPILLTLFVLPLTACVGPDYVPLPSDVHIVGPDQSVPPGKAAFLGKWRGKWDGRNAARLVVEQISGDKVDVIYAWGKVGYVAPDFRRYEAVFEGDTLVFATPVPSTYRFKMRPDDTLEGRFYWNGGLSKATFVRTN